MGEPANFLDVGGKDNEEQVKTAFSIILEDPNVKGIGKHFWRNYAM